MPGIFGFTIFHDSMTSVLSVNALRAMQRLLFHRSELVSDELFCDSNVYAGRCHLGITSAAAQPARSVDCFAWLEGEFYDDNVPGHDAEASDNDGARLLSRYAADRSFSFLRSINGVFSAVIYDRKDNTVHLISDRYGLSHLYYMQTRDYFAWSTEYKAFMGLPGFTPSVDRAALQSFQKYGYLVGEQTWFQNVTLLAPATIVTCTMSDKTVSSKTYWNWDRIKPLDRTNDIDELAREWGRRFVSAVEKQSKPLEEIGVTLSGGLDSRAIVAAIPRPESGSTITAITFGNKGCDDIRIARKVSKLHGARHRVFELDDYSWLAVNISAVWASDGEVCFLDTNANEHLREFARSMRICLNGIGGDAIHGGSFLSMANQFSSNPLDPYGDRGRRFIRPGFRIDESFYHVRMPFYDNSLVEFTVSLPKGIRKNAYFYKKALLLTFPEYFRRIPWQKTGAPISYPGIVSKAIHFKNRLSSLSARAISAAGIAAADKRLCVDQQRRTRKEPGRSFLSALISNAQAIYPEYVDKKEVLSLWDRHLRGADETRRINRIATVELWLQQVFASSYRPDPQRFPWVSL